MSVDESMSINAIRQLNVPEKKGIRETEYVRTEENKNEKLMEACRDFESIFVAHMLKTMRQSSESEDGLFGNDFGGDIFQDMFDGEVARKIARDQSIGLARLLYESLEKYLPPGDLNGTEGGINMHGFPHDTNSMHAPETGDPVFRRVCEFHPLVINAAKKFDIDPSLIYAIISRESGGNPSVVSSKGAKGLMQLMDGTASDMGIRDPFDPGENIEGGTRYFRMMLDRFDGDIRLALAAYNAGPGSVDEYGGIPPYQETVQYVERVLDTYERVKPLFKV